MGSEHRSYKVAMKSSTIYYIEAIFKFHGALFSIVSEEVNFLPNLKSAKKFNEQSLAKPYNRIERIGSQNQIKEGSKVT